MTACRSRARCRLASATISPTAARHSAAPRMTPPPGEPAGAAAPGHHADHETPRDSARVGRRALEHDRVPLARALPARQRHDLADGGAPLGGATGERAAGEVGADG